MKFKRKVCINCHLIQSRTEKRCYLCNSQLRNVELSLWEMRNK